MRTISFPAFPSIDLSNLDLSKIEIPKIDMPKIDMPKIDGETVANVARDAAYIAIGLAVLTVQKVQVRRREITKSVSTQANDLASTARKQARRFSPA